MQLSKKQSCAWSHAQTHTRTHYTYLYIHTHHNISLQNTKCRAAWKNPTRTNEFICQKRSNDKNLFSMLVVSYSIVNVNIAKIYIES